MYIIKAYRIKNLKGEYPFRTWDLEYISDLPYLFEHKPVNICKQLNEMFEGSIEHVIAVR